jgi:hypothetical protein
MPAPIDPRVLDAGLAITVVELADVWADHYPANLPYPENCPGCGHSYITGGPLCPTAALVRPILRRRQHEVPPHVIARRLTYCQYDDLKGRQLYTDIYFAVARQRAAEQAAQPLPQAEQLDLFATLLNSPED